VDPDLVGVWQSQRDDKEFLTFRADGTLAWRHRGDPVIGILDFIVEYTCHTDLTKSPARLSLTHPGIMGTSCFIYEMTDDELRIGLADGHSVVRNPIEVFGTKDTVYKRVFDEPGE
jgi:hypothetical protein